ncbi:hypothetical protein chiPu_0031598, partial [Chiloscyllium punctatum]|nr:hypothetical protein [Chiloscyllium punctatum]
VRAAQHMPPGGDAAHDQAGIRRRQHAHREIVVLVDQVDIALADREVDLDLRIGRQELDDRGRQELRQMGVGVDAQRAARHRLQCAGDVVGLLDVGEDMDAAVVIGLADLGEADLARGAVEQSGTEAIFQRLHVVAHHCRGHVELAAGRGEAAGINDPDERGQTGQAIHAARSGLSALA